MNNWNTLREQCTVFEDSAVLVLNKPAGIAVMAEGREVDIMTLARDAGEKLLPAHRIDKVTSGAVVFAKVPQAHAQLTRQFNRRLVDKLYLAVTRPPGLPDHGVID